MYQCMKCGRTYSDPCKQYDELGYAKDVCPYCESPEWERVTICERCGNPGHYLEKYCETCKWMIRNSITSQIDMLVQVYKYDMREIDQILIEIVEEHNGN